MEEEEIANCPFNKSHMIDKTKLITHINRCKDKKKFPDEKLYKCSGKALYYLNKDREEHMKGCESCNIPKVNESINVSYVNATIINPNQFDMTMNTISEISFNEDSFADWGEKKENSNIY
jgi:hypothetical protein